MAGVMHVDSIVLGGGSGGIAFARRAASYGAKVALVECSKMGGTCVNVGCVPKKIMWCAANAFESLHGVRHLGVDFAETPHFTWERLVQNRDSFIQRLNRIYEANLDTSKVERLMGWAQLVRPNAEEGPLHAVAVNDTREDADKGVEPKIRILTKHVLLATGGRPKPLSIPGSALCADSDGFFRLKQQPLRVGVIGAGYIAVELAGVLRALGTETHLFVRHSMPLRKFDSMIQQQADRNLRSLGVHVHPHSIPSSVTGSSGSLHLHIEGANPYGSFDCIINAIGRVPNVQGLGLETVGVHLEQGTNHIVTDEFQNTNVEGIFAIGDVCGKVELTPMAIAAGRRLADRLYGRMPNARADYSLVPTVIFAHPPIASVGMAESEAKAQFGEADIRVYESSSVNLMHGAYDIPPDKMPRTFIKLVCRVSKEEKILGLHIVGIGADEMMQGFAVATKMGARKADFDACVAIHPTSSEEVVTLPVWGISSY